jgi:acetate kinase
MTRERILVLNAGSSSVKFSIFDCAPDDTPALAKQGEVDAIGIAPHFRAVDASRRVLIDDAAVAATHADAIALVHRWLVASEADPAFTAVAHRLVHGGAIFSAPVLVDDSVLATLDALVPLAPLHQPVEIAGIRTMAALAPDVPQIACFDTAFHRRQPDVARAFALPRELTAKGIRRYGFHGLSYEYIVSALPRVAPKLVNAKLVVAHLGNGASMCAIHAGRPVATTMGFTALDGLVMGTRCGSLDPGVVLYLLSHEGMEASELERMLYQRSGLLGVSQSSSDMRVLLASDDAKAKEAVDLFVYRVGRELGSLAAALGGLDAIVFTAGIGEHAAPIRARVCRDAAWLGVALDVAANERHAVRISRDGARASAWVIPTDENLMVAHHAQRLLA